MKRTKWLDGDKRPKVVKDETVSVNDKVGKVYIHKINGSKIKLVEYNASKNYWDYVELNKHGNERSAGNVTGSYFGEFYAEDPSSHN